MRKLVITVAYLMGLANSMRGQQAYHPYIAKYLSCAPGGVNFSNPLNAAYNPAVAPYIKTLQIASFIEKKYSTDINLLLIGACTPLYNNNRISFMFQHFGNTLFHEKIFGLAYAKNLGIVNAGILFQNFQIKVQGGESISLIRAGIASSVKLHEHVFASCRIINPNLFAKNKVTKLHAASSFSIALGWTASTEVFTAMESLKDEGRPLTLIFTLHYKFADKFSGTLNWNTYSNEPFAALSWQMFLVTIEAGCSYHSALGVSPTICFLYKKRTGK